MTLYVDCTVIPVHYFRGNTNWDKSAYVTNMKKMAEKLSLLVIRVYIAQVQERIRTSKKTSDVS